MMFLKDWKKLFLVLTLVILSSCGTGCKEADDFGDSGDYAQISVYANSANCSYDDTKKVNENANQTIVNCLRDNTLAGTDFITKNSEAIEKSISGGVNKIRDLKCNNFDDNQNSQFQYIEGQELNGKSLINEAYQKCVKACQNTCENGSSDSTDIWERPDRKSKNGSNGIDITPKTLFTVKATGNVVLSSPSDGDKIKFYDRGRYETRKEKYLPSSTSIDLKIEVPLKEDNTTASTESEKREVLKRTYLEFNSVNRDYILDTGNIQNCEYLKQHPEAFQEVNYASFTCEYYVNSKSQEDSNKLEIIQKNCSTDYKRVFANDDCSDETNKFTSLLELLNKKYSFSSLASTIDVFYGENFYKYSNDIANYIVYEKSDGRPGSVDKIGISNEGLRPTNSIKIESYNDNGYVVNGDFSEDGSSTFKDSYFWNSGDSFSFSLEFPAKLAIKKLDDINSDTTCKYTVEEAIAGTQQEIFGTDAAGKKIIEYTANSEAKGNKWQVLKYPDASSSSATDKEIIFNPFSTDNKTKRTATITFNISNTENKDNCKKVLIKLLPVRDFEAKNTGYLFFNIVDGGTRGTSDINSKSLKLTILNKSALLARTTTYTDGSEALDETYRISSFFELGDSRYNYVNLDVKLTSTGELTNIDRENYQSLINDKSVFIRSGQIVRFDYSNWLTIDGQQEITFTNGAWGFTNASAVSAYEAEFEQVVATAESRRTLSIDTYTDENASAIQVPFGLGLIAVVKKALPFLCYGDIVKTVTVDSKCVDINGSVVNDREGENSYCSIEENDCMVGTELQKQLNNIGANGASLGENSYSTVTIQEFVESVLSKYESLSDKCDNEFLTVLKSTYEKVNTCLSTIRKGNYNAYYATHTDDCSGVLGKLNTSTVAMGEIKKANDDDSEPDTSIKKYCGPINIDEPLGSLSMTREQCISGIANISRESIENYINKLANAFGVKKTNCQKIEIPKDPDEEDSEVETHIQCGYTNYFSYFKKDEYVCGGAENYLEESKLCRSNNEPACYNLSNYNGSFKNFIAGLNYMKSHNLIAPEDQSINGFIAPRDRKSGNGLGAELVSTFAGTSGILSDNFEYDSENVQFQYGDKMSLGNDSYITPFYIKKYETPTNSSMTAYYNGFKQLFTYKNGGSQPYLIVSTTNVENVKNGEFLSVILGINDESYLRNPPEPKGNTEFLYLVKYDCETGSGCKLAGNSPAMFNSDGLMVQKNNTSNSVFSTKTTYGLKKDGTSKLLSDYITEVEGTQKNGNKQYTNLFFKIIDSDGKAGNNSGAYAVLINAATEGQENVIITLFRKFFKVVLGFIDGSETSLLIDNQSGNKIPCGSEATSTECSIFDEDNIEDNGSSCSSSDEHCYRNCSNMEAGTTCKNIHDEKGFVRVIVLKIIQNTLFNFIIKISFILMLAMYGFNFFLGRVEMAVPDLLRKIVKMCFVYFMLTESGWNLFNDIFVGFFKTGIDSLLFLIASSFDGDMMSSLSQAVAQNNYSDKLVLFETGLNNLQMIFSDTLMAKIAGLAFSSWYGLVYLYLVLTVIISYVIAVFTSIILYLNAQIYLSLAFTLFPLVLLFFIFDSTKASMDNWFKMIVGFTFQQIFMILTISFFNNLIYNLIRNLFAYRVCWLPLFNLKFASFDFFTIKFWKIPNNASTIASTGTLVGGPSFYSILTFYIVGVLMGKFITGMTDLGNSIAGGGVGISGGIAKQINDGVASARKKLNDFAKETGKQFVSQTARRFGLDFGASAGTKYDNDAIRANADRKAARQGVISNASASANKQLSDYRNSDEFKSFVDETKKSGGSRREQDRAIEQHLETQRRKMFNDSAVADAMGSEYMLNKIGSTKEQYGNMTDDQKTVMQSKMRDYLTTSGILYKEKGESGGKNDYSLNARTGRLNLHDAVGGNTTVTGVSGNRNDNDTGTIDRSALMMGVNTPNTTIKGPEGQANANADANTVNASEVKDEPKLENTSLVQEDNKEAQTQQQVEEPQPAVLSESWESEDPYAYYEDSFDDVSQQTQTESTGNAEQTEEVQRQELNESSVGQTVATEQGVNVEQSTGQPEQVQQPQQAMQESEQTTVERQDSFRPQQTIQPEEDDTYKYLEINQGSGNDTVGRTGDFVENGYATAEQQIQQQVGVEVGDQLQAGQQVADNIQLGGEALAQAEMAARQVDIPPEVEISQDEDNQQDVENTVERNDNEINQPQTNDFGGGDNMMETEQPVDAFTLDGTIQPLEEDNVNQQQLVVQQEQEQEQQQAEQIQQEERWDAFQNANNDNQQVDNFNQQAEGDQNNEFTMSGMIVPEPQDEGQTFQLQGSITPDE